MGKIKRVVSLVVEDRGGNFDTFSGYVTDLRGDRGGESMSLLSVNVATDPSMNNGYPGGMKDEDKYSNNGYPQKGNNLKRTYSGSSQPISPFPTPSPSPPSQPFSPREDFLQVSQLVASQVLEKDRKWFFSVEQLNNSPSRKLAGLSSHRESDYRRQAANLM